MFSERIFEDHECLVENLLFWPKETNNKVMFVPRPERYHFFTHPEVSLNLQKSGYYRPYMKVCVQIDYTFNLMNVFQCYLPLEDGKLSHHVSDAQRSQMLDVSKLVHFVLNPDPIMQNKVVTFPN